MREPSLPELRQISVVARDSGWCGEFYALVTPIAVIALIDLILKEQAHDRPSGRATYHSSPE